MKSLKFFLVSVCMLVTVALFAQEKTDSIKVYGNCGMCKSRIEKALAIEGVKAASWNKDTKMLTVTYNAAQITNEAIQKKVADVGHDTELFSASGKVYDKLHGCCKYDRKQLPAKG